MPPKPITRTSATVGNVKNPSVKATRMTRARTKSLANAAMGKTPRVHLAKPTDASKERAPDGGLPSKECVELSLLHHRSQVSLALSGFDVPSDSDSWIPH